ncbi:TRAP transporter large permease [Sphingomonas sp. ASY06-1R]|uniref:TRAP transporter large permease n=1 Tax=Sphingomonas sp. ASY06-1R TaxID=3445771 RepID=UPI003FA1C7BF
MMAAPPTGMAGILLLFAMLALGVPIGVSLGIVGIGGTILVLGLEPGLIKAGVVVFDTMTRYELGTLPLFLLVAHLCFSADASRDLFDAAARLLGHRRGGLALASIGGCATFGAVNGSSLATAATVGLVALPEMRARGYSDSLATGTLAAGGTLGPLIPPSGALIVFGIIAEQSIGTLFTAALLPALTQMLLYMGAIAILVRFKPEIAPPTPRASWRARFQGIARVTDLLLLIVVMISGIALGWFTPSEAASVGCVGAMLISLRRGRLNRHSMMKALEETLRTSGMITLIIVGALMFSVFISITGITGAIGAFLEGLHAGPTVTMLAIAAILLLLGSVLDGLALMLLTTPILLPIVVGLHLSPIWFGIFLVRAMEIGFVHPPIGMNLYVIHGIAPDVPLSRIFRGVVPFLIADLFHLLLIILVPASVMFLPDLLAR